MADAHNSVLMLSDSAEVTRAFGRAIGAALAPGELVLLEGPFGAGKTVLVQGMAEGLGIDDPVTSPSFVLMVEHEGARRLVHVDFFRIERADTALIASIEEYLDAGWIVAIEWPDWLPRSLAGEATIVRIESLAEHHRRITVHSRSQTVMSSVRSYPNPPLVRPGT